MDHDMRDIDLEDMDYTPVLGIGVLTGPERTHVRLDALERRIETLERNLRNTEAVLHRLMNGTMISDSDALKYAQAENAVVRDNLQRIISAINELHLMAQKNASS